MDESDNLSKSYVWGIDISGSEQGAGGVGGLLMASDGSVIHFPAYDGNGNITAYTDGSSALAASYEYSPFGALTASSGSTFSPFRFSTKCYNTLTGLYYYGFRYYSPRFARWINRDPIGENGGINLYTMVGNDAVNNIDNDGRQTVTVSQVQRKLINEKETAWGISKDPGVGSSIGDGKTDVATRLCKEKEGDCCVYYERKAIYQTVFQEKKLIQTYAVSRASVEGLPSKESRYTDQIKHTIGSNISATPIIGQGKSIGDALVDTASLADGPQAKQLLLHTSMYLEDWEAAKTRAIVKNLKFEDKVYSKTNFTNCELCSVAKWKYHTPIKEGGLVPGTSEDKWWSMLRRTRVYDLSHLIKAHDY